MMTWSRPCWLAAFLFVASVCDTQAEPHRVLMLHSFGRNFEPFISMPNSFREELVRQSHEGIDFQETSVEIVRPGDNAGESAFVNYLGTQLSRKKADLLVTFGAPAANIVLRHRADLLPDKPLLITGIEERRLQIRKLADNEVVAGFSLDIRRYIENILRVRPDTRNIAIVSGASPLDKFWLSEMHREFRPFADRVNFTWLNDVPFEEVVVRASVLPPQSAIFFAILITDVRGIPYDQDRAVARLRAVANAPIFGVADYHFGNGIVGGPMFSTLRLGRQAASIATRILHGEPPSALRTPPLGVDVHMYDGRELKRWNISESLLPPGSEVLFRQPTVWVEYRMQIIAGIAVLAFQAAMISWLLVEQYRRHRAEARSRGHLLELMHLNRTAGAGVMSAAIAHEINQPLGAIMSNAEAGELLLQSASPDVPQLKDILRDIRQADQHAAAVILRLRQFLRKKGEIERQEFDLNDAISATIQILAPEARRRGIVVIPPSASPKLRVRADQVHLQQVMINIAMNSMDAMQDCAPGSRRIAFQLASHGDSEARIEIADTGPGIPNSKLNEVFDPFYTTKEQGTGIGLSITRTIVETYGGKIWAENGPDGGALFRFTFPLTTPA